MLLITINLICNTLLYRAGYVEGDLSRLVDVHALLEGQLSLPRLIETRYLRFWSGKTSDLERIWSDIAVHPDKHILFDQLPTLLDQLDRVAAGIREEMERESLDWMAQDLEHEALSSFFSLRSSMEVFLFVISSPGTESSRRCGTTPRASLRSQLPRSGQCELDLLRTS
jgi:hypothetical protein